MTLWQPDVQAITIFECILPLMPELFRFSERESKRPAYSPSDNTHLVGDNDDLVARTDLLLSRMCGVSPPRELINPLLDSVFNAIKHSSVRPVLNVAAVSV